MSKRICPIHGSWSKTDKVTRCPQCHSQSSKEYDKSQRNKESKRIYDSKRWREQVRPSVLVRDNYKCVSCGYLGRSDELVVDHIVELRDGGSPYDKTNLQTLCHKCHNKKTNQVRRNRDAE